MKQKDKILSIGVFRIFVMLLLCAALFSGCADDNDKDNPGNPTAGAPVTTYITVNPSSISADGKSEATVTVLLVDDDAKPVLEDTPVFLDTTMGTIISANPASTSCGRAQFTVQAPTYTGRGYLSLLSHQDSARAEIVFGSLGSGIPASIQIEQVSPAEIAVTGVGERDNANVLLRIVDESETTIGGSDYMMRARILARPHGGEYLNHDIDNDKIDDEIIIPIIEGTSSFNLQSGHLPGVVEIEVEVLHNDSGKSLDPAVKTLIQRISIASGPPHMLFLERGRVTPPGECINPPPGFLALSAGLSVNDRWGNAVPDGTVINLGIMDSVISSGKGSIAKDSNILTHTEGDTNFETDSILRSGKDRYIEPGDRVIIKSAKSWNKHRFVDDMISDGRHRLYVTTKYKEDETDLEYIVGASLLGGSIHGCNYDGTATKGTIQTKEGFGQVRLVYPESSVDHPEKRVISIFTTSDVSGFVLILLDEGALDYLPE